MFLVPSHTIHFIQCFLLSFSSSNPFSTSCIDFHHHHHHHGNDGSYGFGGEQTREDEDEVQVEPVMNGIHDRNRNLVIVMFLGLVAVMSVAKCN